MTPKELKELEQAALSGEVPAMAELGEHYFRMREFEQATEWWESAATEAYNLTLKGQGAEYNENWGKDIIAKPLIWRIQWVKKSVETSSHQEQLQAGIVLVDEADSLVTEWKRKLDKGTAGPLAYEVIKRHHKQLLTGAIKLFKMANDHGSPNASHFIKKITQTLHPQTSAPINGKRRLSTKVFRRWFNRLNNPQKTCRCKA